MQHGEPGFAYEVMSLQVSAGRDKVSASHTEPMLRRMRPRDFVSRHVEKVAIWKCRGKHDCYRKPAMSWTAVGEG